MEHGTDHSSPATGSSPRTTAKSRRAPDRRDQFTGSVAQGREQMGPPTRGQARGRREKGKAQRERPAATPLAGREKARLLDRAEDVRGRV